MIRTRRPYYWRLILTFGRRKSQLQFLSQSIESLHATSLAVDVPLDRGACETLSMRNELLGVSEQLVLVLSTDYTPI